MLVMLYAGLDLSRSNTVSTSMFYFQGRAGFGEESGDISTYWFLINRKYFLNFRERFRYITVNYFNSI